MGKTASKLLLFALIAVAVALLMSETADAGNKGPIKVGRRGFFDGAIDTVDKKGGAVQGRYVASGRKTAKGVGASLARETNFGEMIFGPADGRTFAERSIDLQQPRPYVPYADGGPPLSYSQGRSSGGYGADGDCEFCGPGCDCGPNCDCGYDDGGNYGPVNPYVPSQAYYPQQAVQPASYGAGVQAGQQVTVYDAAGNPVAVINTTGGGQLSTPIQW